MESLCGITKFLTASSGFEAIIKQRYSDFCVHEIDKSEKTLQLSYESETPQSEPKCSTASRPSVNQNACDSCLTKHVAGLEAVISGCSKEYLIKLEESDPKERRGELHKAIRERYPDMESTTIEKDGVKAISVVKLKMHLRKRKFWPQERGDFCHFVLYKENIDTHKAISLLARAMHVPESKLAVAGNKDKRGITTQAVSVYRVEAADIRKACSKLTNIHVGCFRYLKTGLQLGDLFGNRFTITLRNINSTVEHVTECIQTWEKTGFINYFGLQRFGTQEVATWEIGKALVCSDWQLAINLILSEPRGYSDLREALKVWADAKDARKAYSAIPNRLKKVSLEANLLKGLMDKSANDLVGALHYIPRNSRLLYLHSFQSYLWNLIVSERVERFGTRVMAGDLVMKPKEDGFPENDTEAENGTAEKTFEKVEEVVMDPSCSVDYTQIVLPLPGFAVRLPDNETKAIYADVLATHNMTLDGFDSCVKDYALKGDYRCPFVKPRDVDYSFFGYDDPTISLIRSDLEVLQNGPEPVSIEGARFLALRIAFTLPASSYATMAVRELNKTDSSFAKQLQLNDKHSEDLKNEIKSKHEQSRGDGKDDCHDSDQ